MSKISLKTGIQKLKRFVDRPIIQNILIVGVVTLGIKGIGFYKELVIAENLGLSELLDTFLIAMLVPSFISTVFLGSYKNVFIPNYVVQINQKGSLRDFQTTSILITLSIAFFFMLIAYLFSDIYLTTIFPEHTEQYYDLIRIQLHYLLPCIAFWAVSSLLSGLLQVDKEYLHSTISGVFMSIATIVSLTFFREELEEKVLVIGILVGSFLGLLYLIIVSIKRGVIKIGKPNFSDSNIKQLIKQVPVKISSALINSLNPVVDQFFSAQLIIGSIAALNYGLKIPMLVVGLIGTALGNVLLPYFSDFAASNMKKAYLELNKILKYNLLICTIIALILYFLSEFVVSLVFERREFTADDTQIVYRVQEMYLIQVPFYVSGLIMNRFLTSINRNSFLVTTSVISLFLNVVLNYVLIEIMGVYGLALSTSLVSLVNTVIIYLYIQRIKKIQHV